MEKKKKKKKKRNRYEVTQKALRNWLYGTQFDTPMLYAYVLIVACDRQTQCDYVVSQNKGQGSETCSLLEIHRKIIVRNSRTTVFIFIYGHNS